MKRKGVSRKSPPEDDGGVEARPAGADRPEAAEKYRRIFENIQDVYYEVGLDGLIQEISPSIERYFPLRREAWLGRPITDFYVDPQQRETFLRTIRESGSVHDFEIQLRAPTGPPVTCAITAAILPGSDDAGPRIVGVLRDISVRKRIEQALREREEELSIQSRNLAEMNAALKVLLRQREEDRLELQEQIRTNVRAHLLPALERLKTGPLTAAQRTALEEVEGRLREITAPFLHRISQLYANLTPQEIRVAEGVKNGQTTKEIARRLGLAVKTVDDHRNHIRRKLGLAGRPVSLRSFLLTLS